MAHAQTGQVTQECVGASATALRFHGDGFPSGSYRVVEFSNPVPLGTAPNGQVLSLTGTLGTFYYIEDSSGLPQYEVGPFIPAAVDCADQSACGAGSWFDVALRGYAGPLLHGGNLLNGNFNAIVGGNFTSDGTGDSEGRLAVGGNYSNPGGAATYTVGGGAPTLTGGPNSPIGWDNFLVAGSITGRVGVRGSSIFATGTPDLYQIGTLLSGLQLPGSNVVTDYLNIPGIITHYQSESTFLSTANIGVQGTTTLGPTVTFDGLGLGGIVVFNLPSAAAGTSYNFQNVGNATTIIVNVAGAAATFSGGQIFREGNSIPYPITGPDLAFINKTLWNLHEATSLTLSGYALNGSLIAPFAQNSNLLGGAINGQSIINGDVVQGGGFEFHNFCFTVPALNLAGHVPGLSGDVTIPGGDTVVNLYGLLATDTTVGGTQLVLTNRSHINPSANPLVAGDLLMIYTAQGATVDTTSNSSEFGAVQDYNNSGRYEFVMVVDPLPAAGDTAGTLAERTFNVSNLCGGISRVYTAANSATQVIRVPQYANLTINDGASIVAAPWFGPGDHRGGVVAFFVRDTLTLLGNARVHADGRGFRGGLAESTGAPNEETAYFTTDIDVGANKGEGIAGSGRPTLRSRGAWANGGGGGTSHNAGGGGGANGGILANWAILDSNSNPINGGQGVPDATFVNAWMLDPTYAQAGNALWSSHGGGRGGYSWSNTIPPGPNQAEIYGPGNVAWGNLNGPTEWTGDSRREVGGLGGRPVPNDPNERLFLGGGGGAGHGNNNQATSGGNGGGLVFVVASQVEGTGSITSNGNAGQDSPVNTGQANDAPSGGGAGGTIVLRANVVAPAVSIQANGGKGGDQIWGASPSLAEAEGPGGGGGGGYIALFDQSATTEALGGAAGFNDRPFFAALPSNGATRGGLGLASESVNFVNLCSGSISGRLFFDNDANGIFDGTDSPLANRTVTLLLSTGDTMTVVTNGDGIYNAIVPLGTTVARVVENTGGLAGLYVTNGTKALGTYDAPEHTQSVPVLESTNAGLVEMGFTTNPLAVDLAYFIVEPNATADRLVLRWETEMELDSVGFHIYRWNNGTRGERLTTSLIPALGNDMEGALYQFTDPLPWYPGEVRGYLMVETELYGTTQAYGPFWSPAAAEFNTTVTDWHLLGN